MDISGTRTMVLRGNGPGCTRMRAYACTRGSLQLATSSGHLCSPTTEPQAPRLKPLVGQDGTCCCSPRGEPATCKDEASSFSHAVDGGSYHGSELSSILHFWASVSTARGARPRVGRACCDGLIERRIDALASTDICNICELYTFPQDGWEPTASPANSRECQTYGLVSG
jgi:hypothetical protein